MAGRHLFLRVPSSMWRVVLHYPGLSSGSPQGPTVLCTTQLTALCAFFSSKKYVKYCAHLSIWAYRVSGTDV